ncbi:MAG TPA: glycosyltransferase family 4 protein [Candidatus Binataceae bacterium]|nr:glycosyltransferase family 4 protein [Candidatus Binataceae bacterium]
MNSQVVMITHARFHSFDLAAQLQKAGRLAAVYTGYPKFKLRDTGIDPRLIRSFPWFQVPFHALTRLPFVSQNWFRSWNWHGGEALNRYAARTLPECGLVTALSGSGARAGAVIKACGGVYVCDRGSTHIEWVERELAREYDALGLKWAGMDPRPTANECREYALADAITVPSQFVRRTFVEMGVPGAKVHVVPYGVDLAVFRPAAERASNFRVLFVAQLSVRKGLHYLLDAFARAALPDAELVLAGSHTPDTDFLLRRGPMKNVTWLGPLPRAGVVREMSRASVLVLPSIEEGMAMVQAQALACGCPVISTVNAGAEDLFTDGREGFIVPPRDVDALAERMTRLYRDPKLRVAMGAAALARVKALGGWDSYGRQSLALFDALMQRAA